METIILKVEEFIKRHALIEKGDRVLLSLSAGKDSMFMFHVMEILAKKHGFDIGIFHLNHLTRGDESDLDERHVARLSSEHGIQFFLERHDFAKDDCGGISFEERARNTRYRMLKKTAGSNGYNKIATAHTMSDQVETVLMRIFAGTGIHGLQGIPPRRGNIIRPLLPLPSRDIYEYLREHAIEWREDSSNTDMSPVRNFIRHEIIPSAEKRFPMLMDSIQSLSEVAGDAVTLINDMVADRFHTLVTVSENDVYVEADLVADNYPVFCHVVSTVMRDHFNHHVNRSMLREIHAKYGINRANVSIYEDREIKVEKVFQSGRSRLRISEKMTARTDASDWEYRIDVRDFHEQRLDLREIGVSITIKIADYDYFIKFNKNNSYIFVTLENNCKPLYIRNRRNGDRIKTEKGTKKIKDLLIEKKLDNASKELVPLLVSDTTVIACMPGLLFDIPNRVGVDFLVDKKAKKVLAVLKN